MYLEMFWSYLLPAGPSEALAYSLPSSPDESQLVFFTSCPPSDFCASSGSRDCKQAVGFLSPSFHKMLADKVCTKCVTSHSHYMFLTSDPSLRLCFSVCETSGQRGHRVPTCVRPWDNYRHMFMGTKTGKWISNLPDYKKSVITNKWNIKLNLKQHKEM